MMLMIIILIKNVHHKNMNVYLCNDRPGAHSILSKRLVCLLHCFRWPDQTKKIIMMKRIIMMKIRKMMKMMKMRKMMMNPPLKAGETSAPGNKEFLIHSPQSHRTVQVIQGNLLGELCIKKMDRSWDFPPTNRPPPPRVS